MCLPGCWGVGGRLGRISPGILECVSLLLLRLLIHVLGGGESPCRPEVLMLQPALTLCRCCQDEARREPLFSWLCRAQWGEVTWLLQHPIN